MAWRGEGPRRPSRHRERRRRGCGRGPNDLWAGALLDFADLLLRKTYELYAAGPPQAQNNVAFAPRVCNLSGHGSVS